MKFDFELLFAAPQAPAVVPSLPPRCANYVKHGCDRRPVAGGRYCPPCAEDRRAHRKVISNAFIDAEVARREARLPPAPEPEAAQAAAD
jgi:hypothetical protein